MKPLKHFHLNHNKDLYSFIKLIIKTIICNLYLINNLFSMMIEMEYTSVYFKDQLVKFFQTN